MRQPLLATLLCLFASAASARAEPAFQTLDRPDVRPRGGIDLGVGFYDDSALFDQTALRIDAHAEFVGESGWGGYFVVPMTVLFIDANLPLGGDDEEFALGNLEAGGLYALRLRQGRGWFLFRGGLAVPTADDSNLGRIANGAAVPLRLADAALAVAETSWLRFATSLLGRSGSVFYRVDAGLDVPVTEPDGADPDALLRFNFGLGYDAGPAAITMELATVGEDDYSHTLALGARFTGSPVQPSLAFLVPLDDDLRDTGFDFGILFGVQGAIDRP